MRVSGSRPGPCFIPAAVLASLSANSSCIFCSTKRRVPAQHTCPAQKKTPSNAPCTAASESASLKTMLGDLPPSSSDTRLSVDAVSRWISFPTSVEPVKAILSTMGWRTSAPPAVGPKPGTMLTTPAGTPASSSSSPRRSAVSGVCSAGLSTQEQPLALARIEPCPPAVVERAARGAHGPVDVLLVALCDPREHLARGGVDGLERLPRCRLDPLAVDQHLADRRADEALHRRLELNRCTHGESSLCVGVREAS